MGLLILAALIWLAIHIGLSGMRLRDTVVGMTGERAFPGVFSVLAVAALALLIYAYRPADTAPLWFTPPWLVAVLDAAMLVALVLFAASVIPPGGARDGTSGDGPRGIFRVTRHPMLCSFGIWSAAHLIANGNTASLVFFGTFLVTVLAGIPSLDAKLARRDPAKAAAVQRATSRVPVAAILARRNHFAAGEIGWLPPLAGIIGWVALLYLHPLLFGLPALPPW
jgi:uncharacterized membrane protein